MKLYLISQDINNGWDTYDSAVVSAESPDDAREIHPGYDNYISKDDKWYYIMPNGKIGEDSSFTWVKYKDIDKIDVEYLGETDKERGVILSSFNAG